MVIIVIVFVQARSHLSNSGYCRANFTPGLRPELQPLIPSTTDYHKSIESDFSCIHQRMMSRSMCIQILLEFRYINR